MEDKPSQDITAHETGSASPEVEARRPYHAPKLMRYGGLAELVQANPNRGPDGGGFVDCRLP